MITAEETLPNQLRAAAMIALTTHGDGCPDRVVHERAAGLLRRVADAVESGGRLRAGERDAALQTARAYLKDREPAEAAA
ncbi:hypothetical protein [Actinomadura luteofluorescens]|uniref:hypothetical protein n=1 Tax=Actinomadura luteofluorescens TaxID=46163 RepID=UPI003D8DE4C3